MDSETLAKVSSGIDGLDAVLDGGLISRRCYLVRGAPGQGKTTLGLSFLTAAAKDEASLFIGFQESEDQLRTNAASVGLDVTGIHFLSLAPDEKFFTQRESYDVFSASDVEQGPLVQSVVEVVERLKPTRIFVDSLTQLRFLSADIYQYRKQALSFLRFLTERGATVVFTSETSQHLPDDDLQFLSDGIIDLKPVATSGTIAVLKYRGSRFLSGRHQYRLNKQGFHVFPRMQPPARQLLDSETYQLSSGSEELDKMLNGGLEAGTVTLITGPTGVGKSTLAGKYAAEAALKGRRTAIYLFEEELEAFMTRLEALQVDIRTPQEKGRLLLEQIEPMRYLADEFTGLVKQQIENEGIEVVVLDSITGLDLAVGSMEGIREPLHAFSKTLVRLGVSAILVNENKVSTNELHISERDISYLADNVIFMRYVQPNGSLQKVIGILKKRLSGYDNEQYRFDIGPGGIQIHDKVGHL